jgi:hypothetical protein
MGDFFTRLAERALGMAPTVQPILPSMFAPQPRLKSDFSASVASPVAEHEEISEIPAPRVPKPIELAREFPAGFEQPAAPASIVPQELVVPGRDSRAEVGQEKPPVDLEAAQVPAPPVLKLFKVETGPPAEGERPSVFESPAPHELHWGASESRAAGNQERPPSSSEQVSRPPGDDIQASFAIPPRGPSPPTIEHAGYPDGDTISSGHIWNYDHSQTSGDQRSVGADDQSSKSTRTGNGSISPSSHLHVAPQPVAHSLPGGPSTLRTAARTDEAYESEDGHKQSHLLTPRNLVPSAQLRTDPKSSAESLGGKASVVRGGPTIRVTIGRVEVKVIMPPSHAARPPAASKRASALSLEDYLKRRNGEKK